jgi:hypothetical protein
MSTSKQPMLSTTHAIFRGLQEHIRLIYRDLPMSTPQKIKAGLLDAHQKLSDYYYKFDQSPFYTWAARTSADNTCIWIPLMTAFFKSSTPAYPTKVYVRIMQMILISLHIWNLRSHHFMPTTQSTTLVTPIHSINLAATLLIL